MRPVNKGDGAGRVYHDYQDALDDLSRELGLYCSYCEMPIQNAPEVEHVQPKSLEPELLLSWSNFLLGCKTCNSTKNNKPVSLADTAFPDIDNTYSGFSYVADGSVTVAAGFPPGQLHLINSLVQLVKLHRHPEAPLVVDRPSKRDRRYQFRAEAWLKAEKVKDTYLRKGADPEIGRLISDELAPATGFFSVWMAVFADRPEMLRAFIMAFPGTAADCFAADGTSVLRPGGRF